MSLSAGDLVAGRYKILSLLGQGGMASVYEAADVSSGTNVALKIMHEDQLLEPRRLKRFLSEFKILSRFNDSSIVKVFDQEETESKIPFFTMELIKGKSLASIIKESKECRTKPTILRALSILAEASEALESVHHAGVVLCDFSPQNVIVLNSTDVEVPKLKLIDFGIALFIDSQTQEDLDSKAGTLQYVSPERLSKERVDFGSDMYSFGVAAFELLTGELPFNPRVAYQMEFFHKLAKPPSARDKNPAIPASLDKLMQRCMEKNKEDRFQSMHEVTQQLELIKSRMTQGSTLRRVLSRIPGISLLSGDEAR